MGETPSLTFPSLLTKLPKTFVFNIDLVNKAYYTTQFNFRIASEKSMVS